MKNIYCYVVKEGYAARVQDTKSYDAIRYVDQFFSINLTVLVESPQCYSDGWT